MRPIRDVHSYANPGETRVAHAALDLEVLFRERILRGSVDLSLDRVDPSAAAVLLDTRGLDILGAETSAAGSGWTAARFELGPADAILGAALTVPLRRGDDRIRIQYQTRPGASGLQWLEPAQTAGRRHPFLFSQSQAIHARRWIPIQDTPQVRVTYEARVRTPPELAAVM